MANSIRYCHNSWALQWAVIRARVSAKGVRGRILGQVKKMSSLQFFSFAQQNQWEGSLALNPEQYLLNVSFNEGVEGSKVMVHPDNLGLLRRWWGGAGLTLRCCKKSKKSIWINSSWQKNWIKEKRGHNRKGEIMKKGTSREREGQGLLLRGKGSD